MLCHKMTSVVMSQIQLWTPLRSEEVNKSGTSLSEFRNFSFFYFFKQQRKAHNRHPSLYYFFPLSYYRNIQPWQHLLILSNTKSRRLSKNVVRASYCEYRYINIHAHIYLHNTPTYTVRYLMMMKCFLVILNRSRMISN